MANSPSVNDLLSLWEKEHTDPEELCRDCPQLLPDLRQKIEILEEMQSFLGLTHETCNSGDPSHDSVVDAAPDLSAKRLVLHWQALQLKGQEISAEEICRDHPELLNEVKRLIEAAAHLTQGFTPPTSPSEIQGTGHAARANQMPLTTCAAPLLPESPSQTLGRYRLDRLLGKGGFGEVWQAYDPLLDYTVAIKRPRPDRQFSEEERGQFLAEARTLITLKHPHIVPILHAEQDGDIVFIVSEFINGTNLQRRLDAGRLPVVQSVEIVIAIAQALHHAHLRNVVHRDVKAANILLDQNDKPYLSDFGLAVSEDELLREKPAIMGTYSYMSPEQARGDSHLVDARSDIYSLGVAFYLLLTGRVPFKAVDLSGYREQILRRQPRPPRTIDDAIPQELERICLKCLAKPMEERYTTAADLANDLRQWHERHLSEDSTAKITPPPQQRRRSAFPLRLLLALGGVLAGILVLGMLFIPSGENNPITDSNSVKRITTNQPEPPLAIVRELEPGQWHDLLDKELEFLLWPLKSKPLKRFDPAKKQFEWSSAGDCLLRLGTASVPDYDVKVTLDQTDLRGQRGLFLGCQLVDPEESSHLYECQAILIFQLRPDTGECAIIRKVLRFDTKANRVRRWQSISRIVSLGFIAPSEITLTAHVKEGQLATVKVNGRVIEGLEPGAQFDDLHPLMGDFGIVADAVSSSVTKAMWRFHKGDQ